MGADPVCADGISAAALAAALPAVLRVRAEIGAIEPRLLVVAPVFVRLAMHARHALPVTALLSGGTGLVASAAVGGIRLRVDALLTARGALPVRAATGSRVAHEPLVARFVAEAAVLRVALEVLALAVAAGAWRFAHGGRRIDALARHAHLVRETLESADSAVLRVGLQRVPVVRAPVRVEADAVHAGRAEEQRHGDHRRCDLPLDRLHASLHLLVYPAFRIGCGGPFVRRAATMECATFRSEEYLSFGCFRHSILRKVEPHPGKKRAFCQGLFHSPLGLAYFSRF